ncbi:hypothetical protein [Komagataeibacter diospyri]|uniref:hypothetical protein n=1 Tax=Komagataeibacter diospyri TaxID=1932662 RepID=UPI003756A83D
MVFVMPGQSLYTEEVDPREFIRNLDRHDVEGQAHAMNLIGSVWSICRKIDGAMYGSAVLQSGVDRQHIRLCRYCRPGKNIAFTHQAIELVTDAHSEGGIIHKARLDASANVMAGPFPGARQPVCAQKGHHHDVRIHDFMGWPVLCNRHASILASRLSCAIAGEG